MTALRQRWVAGWQSSAWPARQTARRMVADVETLVLVARKPLGLVAASAGLATWAKAAGSVVPANLVLSNTPSPCNPPPLPRHALNKGPQLLRYASRPSGLASIWSIPSHKPRTLKRLEKLYRQVVRADHSIHQTAVADSLLPQPLPQSFPLSTQLNPESAGGHGTPAPTKQNQVPIQHHGPCRSCRSTTPRRGPTTSVGN